MGAFRETFERVAVKYAEYVEKKMELAVKALSPRNPEHEELFCAPQPKEEITKQYVMEMQTLCQIAETLKNLDTDVIELDADKLDNLQPASAELEALKAIVCYMQEDEKKQSIRKNFNW